MIIVCIDYPRGLFWSRNLFQPHRTHGRALSSNSNSKSLALECWNFSCFLNVSVAYERTSAMMSSALKLLCFSSQDVDNLGTSVNGFIFYKHIRVQVGLSLSSHKKISKEYIGTSKSFTKFGANKVKILVSNTRLKIIWMGY